MLSYSCRFVLFVDHSYLQQNPHPTLSRRTGRGLNTVELLAALGVLTFIMKHSLRYALLLLTIASAAFAEAPAVDWQRTLDGAFWSWSEEAASPLYCAIRQSNIPTTISVTKEKAGIQLKIGNVAKSIHDRTVFEAVDGVLYLADFSTGTSGATVIAIDLKSGDKIWESPVKSLGPIEHSAYSNRMNLHANKDVIEITGRESAGLYKEYKRTSDGQTVANRVFSRTYLRNAKDAFLFGELPDSQNAFLIQVPEMDRALSGLLTDTQLALRREGQEPVGPGDKDIRSVWRDELLTAYPDLISVREDYIEHGQARFERERSRARIERLWDKWKSRQNELPRHTRVALAMYFLANERPSTEADAKVELLARLLAIADQKSSVPATKPS